MNWYLHVLRNYAVFSGRARRKEYWMFFLFNMIFGIVLMMMDSMLGLTFESIGYGPLYGLYALFVLIPCFSVLVRRLHDVGKSGWMVLLIFIPLVGAIWLFILALMDSDAGENKYGPSPKGVAPYAV